MDNISLMGLWENTDKNGNKYLSGNIGNAKVMIFKNTYKKAEREPDYRLYIAKKEQKNDGI